MSDPRYKIYDKLGAGGKGEVYRAYDTQLKRWVAIKRLLSAAEASNDDPEFEELRREANTLASLSNANIVTVFDVAVDDEGLFVVMELLQGHDLNHALAHGPLSLADFKELAHQTLEALVAAHHLRILHRDIKPENIKVERLSSGRLQAKIIDFGLARAGLTARKQTESGGTVMGSIYYMAPEQLTRKPTDQRSDLYALGCVLYEAVSGRKAFDAKTVSEVIEKHINHDVIPIEHLCPQLPQWLTYWINRLMAKDPKDRPVSAQQAIDELRAWEMLPPSPHGTGFVPMVQYNYSTTGVVPPQAYHPSATGQAQAVGGMHTQYAPNPKNSNSQQVAEQARKSGPAKTGVQPPSRNKTTPSKKPAGRSLAWLWATFVLGVAAAAAFYFSRSKDGSSLRETIDLTDATPAELKAYDLQYPEDRPFPVLDEQRVMHFLAGVSNRGYKKSKDGSYTKMTNHTQNVAIWDDIASRGGNTYLKPLNSDANLSPRLMHWMAKNHTTEGLRYGQYAVDFGYSAQKPLGMKAQATPEMTEFFPFGKQLSVRSPGVTIGVVFLPDVKHTPMTLLCLSDKEDKYRIIVRVAKGNKLTVDFENTDEPASAWKHLLADQVDPNRPVFLIIKWSRDHGMYVAAKNPWSNTQVVTNESPLPVPQQPLTDLLIGSTSNEPSRQYHGYLSELIVYSAVLNEAQTSVLMGGLISAHEPRVKR